MGVKGFTMFDLAKLLEALEAVSITERMDCYALLALLALRGPCDHQIIFEAFPPLAPAESPGAFYFAELLQPLKACGAVVQLEQTNAAGEEAALFAITPAAAAGIISAQHLPFAVLAKA
jgi:hypothetical protein